MTGPVSWLRIMFTEWCEWASGDSRGSTKYATLENLKFAVMRAGLGFTATKLCLRGSEVENEPCG